MSCINDFNSAFEALLHGKNMYMIRLLISNELVSISDISILVKKYCSASNSSVKLISELSPLLINIGVDISVLQALLSVLVMSHKYEKIIFDNEYLVLVHQLIDAGATLPTDLQAICRFPLELFKEYVSLHPKILSQNVELECCKCGCELAKLEYVQTVLESYDMVVSDPLILFVEAYKKHNTDVVLYCLPKIEYDRIITDKILFMICWLICDKKWIENSISNDYTIGEELSFLLLLCTYDSGSRKFISKYLDPSIQVYKDINFCNYFRVDYYDPTGRKNPEVHKVYFKLSIKVESRDILSDNAYDDLMEKLVFLLNILKQDTKLIIDKKID